MRLRVLRVESVYENLPLLRHEQGIEVLHQGRLAAPVRTDDGKVLALGDLQIDPLQNGGPFRVVSTGQPLRLDHIRILSLTLRAITEAAAIFRASPGRNGRTPATAALAGESLPTRASWRTPRA